MGPLTNSRTEFLPGDPLDRTETIKYKREGGCFLSKGKGFILFLAAVIFAIVVGLLVYNYSPCKYSKDNLKLIPNSDIESEITSMLQNKNNNEKNVKLPENIKPLHYRLRVQPFLDEPGPKNFTFEGRVSIVIQATESGVKEITLHAKNLQINKENVTVTTTVVHKPAPLISLSQIKEAENITSQNISSSEVPSTISTTESQSVNTTQDKRTSVTQNILELNNSTNSAFLANITSSDSLTSSDNRTTSGNQTTSNIPTFSDNSTAFYNSTSSIGENEITTVTTLDTVIGENNPSTISPSTSSLETNKSTSNEPSEVQLTSAESLIIVKQEYDTDGEKYIIHLDSPLTQNKNYTLDIFFSGNLTDDLVGFYRSNYEEDGSKKWLAATQFEATDARKAFPCFDEPNYKANFEISICRRDNNYSSISNMPLKSSEKASDQPGWTWDHFDVSVPMPTYLVGFVVSDFVFKEASAGNVTIKVWSRKDIGDQSDYAIKITPKILNYFSEYFNAAYPLPKLDLVALPDFTAGAMENWGIITFREDTLIRLPDANSKEKKILIATTVAHEVAHQWFGNLVTMKWWTDLWLNEGFATYVSFLGVNEVEPTWHVYDDFVIDTLQSALSIDSYHSTHPVSVQVTDPAEIEEIFDSISYDKGASLIRMLNHSLTESIFKNGLSHYLQAWKYKNSEQDDLWKSLTVAANESKMLPNTVSIKDVMDSWTLQDGYPVISVIRDYNTGSATISQKRFLIDNSTDDNLWYVPLSYQTSIEPIQWSTTPKTWMQKKNSITIQNLTQASSSNLSWVIFNIEQTGYYRVNYDKTNWELIRELLMNSSNSVPVSIRAQLLDDALNLAEAGQLDYSTALNLTQYLPLKETHYIPFLAALQNLLEIKNILDDFPIYGLFQRFVLELISPKYSELGTESRPDDSEEVKTFRSHIVKIACHLDHPQCVNWARDLYKRWMSKPDQNPIPVDVRGTVYCTAIRVGTATEWDFLWNQTLVSSNKPGEYVVQLSSLGCSREKWILTRYLERAETSGLVKLNDVAYVWKAFDTPIAINAALQYLSENWNFLYNNRYKNTAMQIKYILETTFGNLKTEAQYRQFLEFYKENKDEVDIFKLTMAQCLEKTKMRIHWIKHFYPTFKTWLKNYYGQ